MVGVIASLAPYFHGEEALRKRSWVFSKLCLFKALNPSWALPYPQLPPPSQGGPSLLCSGREPYALCPTSVEVSSLVTSLPPLRSPCLATMSPAGPILFLL